MARKAEQLISRGSRTWLIRVSLGHDTEAETREIPTKPFEANSAKSRGACRQARSGLKSQGPSHM